MSTNDCKKNNKNMKNTASVPYASHIYTAIHSLVGMSIYTIDVAPNLSALQRLNVLQKNCFLRNLLINVRPAYFLMLQNRKVAKFLHPTFLIFLYHINHRQNVNNMNNTRGRINIYATETNVFRWNWHLQHYVKTCSQNINLKISINCRTVYLRSC